jgi:hypothetical protein
VRRQDFHLAADQQELESDANLSIETIFSFPELEGLDEDALRRKPYRRSFYKWRPLPQARRSRCGLGLKQPGRTTVRPMAASTRTFDGLPRSMVTSSGKNAKGFSPLSADIVGTHAGRRL